MPKWKNVIRHLIFCLFFFREMSAYGIQDQTGSGQVSQGSKVVLRDGEISLELPKGWKYYQDIPGQTLLALAPDVDSSGFQRAIQIMTFGGPKFLDDVTASEYRDIIARKFSGASAAISNYQMNNHIKIELADGRSAILFYAEFDKDKRKFMQAHILVSNMDRHFVISYTDGAEHFANDAPTPNLNEAWQVLMSTTVKGSTPLRYGTFYRLAGGVFIFFVAIVVWAIYRKSSASKYEQEIKSEFAEDLATSNKKLEKASGPPASLHSRFDSEHDEFSKDEDSFKDSVVKKPKGKRSDDIAG